MRRAIAFVAAGAVATAAVLTASPTQEPQAPVFRATGAAVRVEVGVRDASRRVVEGLTAADFTVKDNGVAQEIVDLTFGRAPIDVTVGLDVSYSVAGPLLERLRLGVTQLARDLRPEDRLRLVVFNLMTQRLVDFTNDTGAVDRAMRAATAGGGTALFDALSLAMISATDADRRQLVVFFTDGQEGASTTSPEVLLAVSERTRATVSFVVPALTGVGGLGGGVGNDPIRSLYAMPSRPAVLLVHPAVRQLASETGGQVLTATQSSSLGPIFLRALDLFRATYVLSYVPRGVGGDGFHTLEVEVARPGVTVQARRGYFAR